MFRNILYKGMYGLGVCKARAFEKSSLNCRSVQEKRLFEILNKCADSAYGRQHNFGQLKTLTDFKNAVPINSYETLSPFIERSMAGEKKVLTEESPYMFATTSGTTGSRKYIPVTKSYMNEFRRASVVSGFHLFQTHPAITRGVVLSVFSTAEEGRTSGGIPYGAISGRLYLDEPKAVRKFIAPLPYEVFVIKDYESRYYTILRCALTMPVSCIYTLNPSTILLLAKNLEIHAEKLIADIAAGTISTGTGLSKETKEAIAPFLKPDLKRAQLLQRLLDEGQFKPDKIWPDLAAISCWTKAAASFYLQDFPQYFGDTPICDITYGASEGRGTVFVSQQSQCLAIDSHFFEFVEESQIEEPSPQAQAAWELETGKSYYILFTTSAGLYRYNLNDIVKVVGRYNQAPLLEFLHKGGNICSFTGEKLTESQVTQAMLAVCRVMDLKANFFTVVPEFRPNPHYQLWVEFDYCLPEAQRELLATHFDRAIGRLNCEYETKRESLRLGPAEVNLLEPGSYRTLRKALVNQGVPDAQIKVSHLNPKPEIKKILIGQLVGQPLAALS